MSLKENGVVLLWFDVEMIRYTTDEELEQIIT